MREFQKCVQNESAAIIGFSQWKYRASQRFEDRGVGPDNRMHSRDERFEGQAHHKAKPDPLYDKALPKTPAKC
jgi:hypothetical protein